MYFLFLKKTILCLLSQIIWIRFPQRIALCLLPDGRCLSSIIPEENHLGTTEEYGDWEAKNKALALLHYYRPHTTP